MVTAILAVALVGFPPPASHFPPDEMPVVAAIKERIVQHQEAEVIRPAMAEPVAPMPEPAAPQPQPASAIPEPWASLAECESNGEWDYNEHSDWGSGIYDGGLQFDPGTWLTFGGGQYAPTADQATPFQQIEIAERVLAEQGWVAWPACSRKLGLR